MAIQRPLLLRSKRYNRLKILRLNKSLKGISSVIYITLFSLYFNSFRFLSAEDAKPVNTPIKKTESNGQNNLNNSNGTLASSGGPSQPSVSFLNLIIIIISRFYINIPGKYENGRGLCGCLENE